MDFHQVTTYLDDALIFGIKPSLIRINKILELMGGPQENADFIHVVGTNGKTSTTIMLAAILKNMGFKTAYHISPHIDSYTERIWLDGKNISQDGFTAAFKRIYPYIREVNLLDLGGPITQFEIISALAFEVARHENIQVMVLEAGMGGRWDATNAAPACVAGLTGVSLEHTDILGDTIEEITAEKVEVIKKGSRAATTSRDSRVTDILRKKAEDVGATYYIYGRDFRIKDMRSLGFSGWEVDMEGIYRSYPCIRLPLPGDYQPLNLSLAVCMAELFLDLKGKRLEPGNLQRSLSRIYVKGRFEILRQKPLVIADASHNPEGVDNTCLALEKYFKDKKKVIIFAVLSDKDYRYMIERVLETADVLILTSSGNTRSLGLEKLSREAVTIMENRRGKGSVPAEIHAVDTVENSLNYSLKISDTNDIICITGSITNLEHIGSII